MNRSRPGTGAGCSRGDQLPGLPVIITTAYMSVEPQLGMLDLPHSGYIVKPFRVEELGTRIDAIP